MKNETKKGRDSSFSDVISGSGLVVSVEVDDTETGMYEIKMIDRDGTSYRTLIDSYHGDRECGSRDIAADISPGDVVGTTWDGPGVSDITEILHPFPRDEEEMDKFDHWLAWNFSLADEPYNYESACSFVAGRNWHDENGEVEFGSWSNTDGIRVVERPAKLPSVAGIEPYLGDDCNTKYSFDWCLAGELWLGRLYDKEKEMEVSGSRLVSKKLSWLFSGMLEEVCQVRIGG